MDLYRIVFPVQFVLAFAVIGNVLLSMARRNVRNVVSTVVSMLYEYHEKLGSFWKRLPEI